MQKKLEKLSAWKRPIFEGALADEAKMFGQNISSLKIYPLRAEKIGWGGGYNSPPPPGPFV